MLPPPPNVRARFSTTRRHKEDLGDGLDGWTGVTSQNGLRSAGGRTKTTTTTTVGVQATVGRLPQPNRIYPLTSLLLSRQS